MSSDDVKKFLVSRALVLASIDGKFDGKSHDDVAWHARVRANARKPAKWKRATKYLVDSSVDRDGGDDGGGHEYFRNTKFAGGTVREFVLEEGDGVRYAVIEVGGVCVHVDDVGD